MSVSDVRKGLSPEQNRVRQREIDKDTSLIKHQLGLSSDVSLPRCPVKAKGRVREFEAKGDMSHSRKHHVCLECGCRQVAGKGTDHYGWGACVYHEKKMTKKYAEELAIRHRSNLMEKNPSVYRNLGKYSALVQREGEEADQRITLVDELQVARSMVQELILAANGEGVDKDGEPVKLYEYVMGEKVEMADDKRITLMTRLLASVSKVAVREVQLRAVEDIPLDEFKVWFSKLWSFLTDLGSKLDRNEITNGEELKEQMMLVFKLVGDPRHKKHKA